MFINGHWPLLAVFSWNTLRTDFTEFLVVCTSTLFSAKYVQPLSLLLHCSVQDSKILFTLFQRFVFLACTVADITNVTGWVSFHCYVCEYTFSSRDYTCGNWQITNHSVCRNSIVFAVSVCSIFCDSSSHYFQSPFSSHGCNFLNIQVTSTFTFKILDVV